MRGFIVRRSKVDGETDFWTARLLVGFASNHFGPPVSNNLTRGCALYLIYGEIKALSSDQ